MGHSRSYVVNDAEVAEKIEQQFHAYVALFMKLHYPADGHTVSAAERRELTLQIKASVNEITLLGMKRKRCKFDTRPVRHSLAQTAGATVHSYRPVSG